MQIKQIFEKQNATAAAVLGLALIVVAVIAGFFLSSLRSSGNVLTTTGSAKMSVVSDSGKLSGSVLAYANEFDLATGYKKIDRDTEKVKAFLIKNGATEEEITISPVNLNQDYSYNDGGQNLPKRYELRATVTVNSTDVTKITNISNLVDDVAGEGVLFQTYGAQYYYSGLADARVALLGDAIVDAKARAREIAKASGGNVGKLKTATSGVVQVLPPNSIDISDYGTYDTSTIDKDVMVTVRATFIIR
jgi:hypothetical protein